MKNPRRSPREHRSAAGGGDKNIIAWTGRFVKE